MIRDNGFSDKTGAIHAIESDGVFAGLLTYSKHIEEPGVEVSYQLLPEFIGKGIAYPIIAEALKQVDLPLVAETQEANTASRRLLEKLGFKEVRFCERYGEKQVIALLQRAV